MTQQPGAGQPKYMAIAADLRARIGDGTYAVGSKLPPVHELGERYGAAANTVRSAVMLLVQEGLAESFQGDGIYVRNVPGADDAPGRAEAAGGIAGLRAEMARELGRIEANLIELYGKTGNEYPWEERPGGDQPAREDEEGGRSEQRA